MLLTVRSTRTDGRVVLFERHANHPDGEAFIASQEPMQVGDTPTVRYKIALGQLELVETLAQPTAPAAPSAPVQRQGNGRHS